MKMKTFPRIALWKSKLCQQKQLSYIRSGPVVIKLFSHNSAEVRSTKFILLINVKMPTIVDILTFISMINTTSES